MSFDYDQADIEIHETLFQRSGRARLFMCVQCGVVLYVPDSSRGGHDDPIGECPRCHWHAWRRQTLPVGPFRKAEQ